MGIPTERGGFAATLQRNSVMRRLFDLVPCARCQAPIVLLTSFESKRITQACLHCTLQHAVECPVCHAQDRIDLAVRHDPDFDTIEVRCKCGASAEWKILRLIDFGARARILEPSRIVLAGS